MSTSSFLFPPPWTLAPPPGSPRTLPPAPATFAAAHDGCGEPADLPPPNPRQVGGWTIYAGSYASRERLAAAPGDPDRQVAFIEKTPRVWTPEGWIYGPKGAGGSGPPAEEGTYGFYMPSRGWCDQMLLALGYDVPGPVSIPMINVAINLAGDYPELHTREEVEDRIALLRPVFPAAGLLILRGGIPWFSTGNAQTVPRMWGRIPVDCLGRLRRLPGIASVYRMDEEDNDENE